MINKAYLEITNVCNFSCSFCHKTKREKKFMSAKEFDLLTDLAVFSCWIFYTLTFVCVIKLRRTHPNLERKYKVPLYPVVPLLAIASGLYVVVSQLFFSGTRAQIMSLVSVVITLVGLPVYLAVKKFSK